MPMLWKWFKRLAKFAFQPKEKKVSDINLNAKNLIDYYCSMKVPPEYALLVKGPWGCGKSHLVKGCIEKLEEANKEFKFLYVSLYGINDISDIEAKFFEQLNPTMNKLLSNKKIMFASRIAKGVLKGAFKIDLDGDNKPDVTASMAVPDINLADYLTDTKNCILVFDDLERCALDLQVILGYINYFVEKDGYKVVLIADEDKLLTLQDEVKSTQNCYVNIKEKLIGKTVQVEADIEHIFDDFVNTLVSESVQTQIRFNKIRIIQLFTQSGYDNLRSMRKYFLDLDQFMVEIEPCLKENGELINHLISLLLVLSMEVHAGAILPNDISKLLGYSLSDAVKSHLEKSKKSAPNIIDQIRKKYDMNFSDPLINVDDWIVFFSQGYINTKSINSTLKKSKYFLQDNTPNWVRLYHLTDLNDDYFDIILISVRQELNNRAIKDLGVVKHLMGTFLLLSENSLIDESKLEIFNQFSEYLKDIFDSNNAHVNSSTLKDINTRCSYLNMTYTSSDNVEFKDFSNLLNDYVGKTQKANLESKSDLIITAMKNDVSQLSLILNNYNNANNNFSRQAILQYIDPDTFIEAYLEMSNIDKKGLSVILSERFEDLSATSPICEELNWLDQFNLNLGKHIEGLIPRVSTIILTWSHEELSLILTDLKEKNCF